MLSAGLVSVTFRKLAPEQIIELVARAGLAGIEWGGDVHVPHGEVETAAKVGEATVAAELAVAAYGSYYRVGAETHDVAFDGVLATAVALGAPAIRVWAGPRGSAGVDEMHWAAVADDSRRIGEMAGANGIKVAYEFHGGTLTDTNASAMRLLAEVDHPNVYAYWQPRGKTTHADCLAGIDAVADRLLAVHAFTWRRPDGVRLSLADGAADWSEYLSKIAAANPDAAVLLEFVAGDDPEQFLVDAETLKQWLTELS